MVVFMSLSAACVYTHYPHELKSKPSSELVKVVIPPNSRIYLEEVDGNSVQTNASGVLFLAPGKHSLFLQYFHQSGYVYYETGGSTWSGANSLSFTGSAGEVYKIEPAPGGKLIIKLAEAEENVEMNENAKRINGEAFVTIEIKEGANAVAVIETKKGNIVFKFFPDDAPNTVDNFKKLANKGFYNGLIFHRVVPNFVIQGGDPKGNGTGGPGYNIKAEFNKKPHLNGTVAMARAQDPDSAGSQFYICLGPQSFLDGNYTVFGQVIEGIDIIHKIAVGDIMEKVYIDVRGNKQPTITDNKE
jgi:peptidylprolyl isomerase/peptidyl-prolyl cis-trans isomerase B (cyclophilin B)